MLPRSLLLLLIGLLECLPAAVAQAQTASLPRAGVGLHWQADGDATNRWAVQVWGLQRSTLRRLRGSDWTDADWGKLLSVVAEQGDLIADVGLPSMLGRYRVEGSSVWFQPRFPLQPGVTYRAALRLRPLRGDQSAWSKLAEPNLTLTSTFQVPVLVLVPTTEVAQVYPTAAELPENLLKFYLEFSAPMSGGHIYDYIHLLDDAGRPVELPFLEIDEELWDPSMTRLTLFIDPGRIKRGVTPLEEVGPALVAGHEFALVIDAGWRDARGARLKAGFRKRFRVGPAIRTPIEPERWKLMAPAAGSTGPLIVRFERSLDWALARRMIQVRPARTDGRAAGAFLAGAVSVEAAETEWRFTPDRPWSRGAWELVVPSTIEDLAGNNIGKSFEVDVFESVQRRITNLVSRLTFEVR